MITILAYLFGDPAVIRQPVTIPRFVLFILIDLILIQAAIYYLHTIGA